MTLISSISAILIVIDSDREHCYEHFKKQQKHLRWKLSLWHVFECLCVQRIFEVPEMAKNVGLFKPNLHEFGLFHPYFGM